MMKGETDLWLSYVGLWINSLAVGVKMFMAPFDNILPVDKGGSVFYG